MRSIDCGIQTQREVFAAGGALQQQPGSAGSARKGGAWQ